MVIANPIYDVVFKRLMENEKVAKFFIGTLLEQTIENIEVKPQEFTYSDDKAGIAVFRLDFVATIKTENGAYNKVLIEIQKARNHIDLMRFRSYLGEQYKKEDTLDNAKVILPITTIYILGFKLPEINTPCLKVDRIYQDLVTHTTLETKSDFVEKLTHNCYVVQVERITNRYQTRLDKLLSVFEQTNFVDNNKIVKEFHHQTDLEEVQIMTEILHHSGTNPAEKKKIEIEQEAWRTVKAMFEEERIELVKALTEKDKELVKKDRELVEKDTELNKKDTELAEKDNELVNKDTELIKKDTELAEKDQILEKLMAEMEVLKMKLEGN